MTGELSHLRIAKMALNRSIKFDGNIFKMVILAKLLRVKKLFGFEDISKYDEKVA